MKAFHALGKRAAAGAAGTGGVLAAQPPAHARAPPAPAPSAVHTPGLANKSLDDGWVLTDFNDEQHLFKPFSPSEVDEVVSQVGNAAARRPPSHSCVVEELDGDAGTASPPTSSEGSQADQVIENTRVDVVNDPGRQQMSDLLNITKKLLCRPGIQREVVAVMMEDPEVRALMLKQSDDVDQYLASVGVHSPNLLLPPAARAAAGQEGADESGGPPPVLEAILNAMESCMSGIAWIGGWMRDRIQGLGDLLSTKLGFKDEQEEQQQQKQQPGAHAGRRGNRSTQNLMTTVMVMSVAVLCMLLARRPILKPA